MHLCCWDCGSIPAGYSIFRKRRCMVKGPYTSNKYTELLTTHNLHTTHYITYRQAHKHKHTAEVGKTASWGLVTIELPIAELLLIQQTNKFGCNLQPNCCKLTAKFDSRKSYVFTRPSFPHTISAYLLKEQSNTISIWIEYLVNLC